jgi:NADH-quinone oxidoreductase subunit G
MVEVEGMSKLQISCRTPAREGMVVHSNSAPARRAQASSLEFHLVNHPLDCPVCDQAGECYLQDYYMRFGGYKSEVKEDKEHKKKRLDIGKHIMLDSERCILCTRCTRFLDTVTKTHELGIFNRGDHSEIALTPGMRVDNPYSGNIADVCPVGALTDKDFRFKVRVWYLDRTPSVCTGCARGCSIGVDSNTKRPWHTGGRRVARLMPRFNPQVNGWWICDEGRYGFKYVDDPTRLRSVSLLPTPPLPPKGGEEKGEGGRGIKKVPWSEACSRIAQELKSLCEKRGSAGLAVVLSGTLSNEDLFTAKALFVDHLKAGHILVRPGPDQMGEEDEILRKKEKVPNHRGAELLGFGSRIKESSWEDIRKGIDSGEIWGLYVVDRDPIPIWGKFEKNTLEKLPFTAYQGVSTNRFAQVARWVLPSCAFPEEEASSTNFEGHVQRTAKAFDPLAESRPDWAIWGDMLKALGQSFPHDTARSIFNHICKTEPAFAGLDWDGLGPHGKRIHA